MAYFNNFNNTNFCSTSSASRELDMYPFLSQQASATEEVDSQAFSTLANRWGMVGRRRLVFGLRPVTVGIVTAPLSTDISRMSLQSRCPRPPHTLPRPTAMVSRHTPDIIGQRLANKPNPTTPAF